MCQGRRQRASSSRVLLALAWKVDSNHSFVLQSTLPRIIRKNQIAIEKAKKQTKKKERSVSKLKMILCLPFLPRFPKFSLHQSSTNILSRMIYQMFTKAEVSTGSYTLSDSLGKLLRLNLT